MSLQKSVQLGGPEVRKRAIRYLLGRRRYEFWHMGRFDQEETMGESLLPEGRSSLWMGTLDRRRTTPRSWTRRCGLLVTNKPWRRSKEEKPFTPPVVTEEDALVPDLQPMHLLRHQQQRVRVEERKGAKSARIQRPAT